MSCLCNQTLTVNITNQLESLASTLAKLEECLAALDAKVARIDVYDDDWDEDDEYSDDEEPVVAGTPAEDGL